MIDLLPLELMLLEYAAGTLNPYESLLIAAHMALRPDSRRKVAAFEAECGRMIAETEPVPLQSGCLDSVMSKIDACAGKAQPCPDKKRDIDTRAHKIPEPVYSLLCRSCSDDPGCWSKNARGIDVMELKVCTSETRQRRMHLMHMSSGATVPMHRHEGREVMLVLDGGFSDCTGHYGRGDILVFNNPALPHAPTADETGCLCLVLTDAPLRYQGYMMKVVSFIRRK